MTGDLEAVQRERFERMVGLAAELDAATRAGLPAPVEIMAQLDMLLLEAVREFEGQVAKLVGEPDDPLPEVVN